MPLFPREKRSIRIFIALIVFHLVLLSFQVPLGTEPAFMEKAVFAVFTPVQHGAVAVIRFLGRIWRTYFYFYHVQRQNQDMRRDIFTLRLENAGLRRSLERFQAREEMRLFLSKIQHSIRIASVIGLDPLYYRKSLIIDQGRLAGVAKDMAVLDRYGHLVGRVIEPVSLTESTVQLITDESSGVGVLIRGDKGVGVLAGDGTGRCVLKYILSTAEGIAVGDKVLTSGYDRIYPLGLPVGTITSVGGDGALFKTIAVRPFFDFNKLDLVAVIALPEQGPAGRRPEP
jgi:rod shape-determining protein MreC